VGLAGLHSRRVEYLRQARRSTPQGGASKSGGEMTFAAMISNVC